MLARRITLCAALLTASLLHSQEDAQAKAARVIVRQNVTNPAGLTLTLDKSTYTDGDIPIITVQTAQDCRVTLFYEGADGKIIQLFPNQHIADNRVRAGKVQLLPAHNPANQRENVAVEIFGPPFGTEHFIVVAGDDTAPVTVAAAEAKSLFPDANAKAARVVSLVRATATAAFVSAPAAAPRTASAEGTEGFVRVTVTTKAK